MNPDPNEFPLPENYDLHVFICTNDRGDKPGARVSCAANDQHELTGRQAHQILKEKLADLKQGGRLYSGRINKSGCLDYCERGPLAFCATTGNWHEIRDRAGQEAWLEAQVKLAVAGEKE